MTLDLCHVFVFVADQHAAEETLSRCGLRESFRRRHPGQGTANICACFDNSYLELLWPEDEAELSSAKVVRTRLAERSRWRETGASPFGIGLRSRLPFPSWDYRPPFLPDTASVPVALASDDPRQPFVFRSPNETRPDAWTDGRAGQRQKAAGLAEITHLRLELPVAPAPAIKILAEKGLISLVPAVTVRMELTISRADGGSNRLALPEFIFRA